MSTPMTELGGAAAVTVALVLGALGALVIRRPGASRLTGESSLPARLLSRAEQVTGAAADALARGVVRIGAEMDEIQRSGAREQAALALVGTVMIVALTLWFGR